MERLPSTDRTEPLRIAEGERIVHSVLKEFGLSGRMTVEEDTAAADGRILHCEVDMAGEGRRRLTVRCGHGISAAYVRENIKRQLGLEA